VPHLVRSLLRPPAHGGLDRPRVTFRVVGSVVLVGKAIKYPAFTIPWLTLAVFLAAAIIAGVATAVIPARRAGRLNILEALQYE